MPSACLRSRANSGSRSTAEAPSGAPILKRRRQVAVDAREMSQIQHNREIISLASVERQGHYHSVAAMESRP